MGKRDALGGDMLGKALRCVTYDILMLKWAIEDLCDKQPRVADLRFGRNEVSLAAALIKFRTLYEFLTRSSGDKGVRDTDILLEDFGLAPRDFSGEDDLVKFRRSLDKFGAHLTYQRASKSEDYPRPTARQARKYGYMLVGIATAVVQECLDNGVRLPPVGRKYYRQLLEDEE